MLSEKRNTNFETASNQQNRWIQSKKRTVVSTAGSQATNNTEIMNVLTFIQQTMETPSEYNQQLKAKLDINLTHKETL